MLGRVEFLAASAKCFMGPATCGTLRDSLSAVAVVMALFRAFSAYLCLDALIGFVVGDFLAVIALFRALSAFECLGVT